MAQLDFKMDESYGDGAFSIAGWLGEEREWRLLESRWRKCIDQQNSRSNQSQSISRFHAAQMNGYKEEFRCWTKDMSQTFCGQLIRLLSNQRLALVSCGGSIKTLCGVFENPGDDKEAEAYGLSLKFVMAELASIMSEYWPSHQVAIIHDSGPFNDVARASYNAMVNDSRWPYGHFFHSITPRTWKQSTGLQAADLAAYETFKALKNTLNHNVASLRYALRSLRDKR